MKVINSTMALVFICLFAMTASAEITNWSGIVIHHSATGGDATVASIDEYHRKVKGWDEIAYHYIIYTNGRVYVGRSIKKHGAHALNGKPYSRNHTHIGICLIGKDKFTAKQEKVLWRLTKLLTEKYDIRTIERHHDDCPGRGYNVEKLERKVLNEK